MKLKQAKTFSYHEALERARKYCAYQERSQQEVRDKLYDLGLHKREVEQGIAEMVSEGFINEQRFAIAFAGGRFRIKQWGKVKIRLALKSKNISDYCIRKALESIDEQDYEQVIKKLIAGRMKTQKEADAVKRNYKVASFVIGRGFEPELVWDLLREAH